LSEQPSPGRGFGRIVLWVGSLGPLGHVPASGTVAVAVAGVPLVWLMRMYLGTGAYAAVSIVFIGASVWIHDVGDRLLGEKDSRKLVLDELCGFFVACIVMPISPATLAIAFFVERAIDIVKVPPANIVERRVAGGWGVVGDDLIAGAYTCGLMWVVVDYLPANWIA